MEAATAATLLLQLIILTATSASSQPSAHPKRIHGGSCIAAERAALLSFKQGITVDPLNLLGSWQGRGCCRWNGIRCGNRTGHVIGIDLCNTFYLQDQRDVYSALYLDNPHGMQGQVSTSLLALEHLNYLDLSGNNLGGGGAIPSFLGSLRNLVYLDISRINFTGRVPPQLGNLSQLLYLDISNIYTRSAQVFSTDISWLGRLSSLRHLDMSGVNLTSITDWAHVVNMLPNLRALHLQSCQLTRSTLVHSNLTLLEDLDLSYNIFYGPLAPNWFWDITSLRTLSIVYSQMYGPIPDELGNMTALKVLDLQDNEDIAGMFPQTLKNLCNLEELGFSSVNLGGDITEQMERLPRCSWEKLRSLEFSDTNMTGKLPVWLGNLTSLRGLYVSDNQISGHVPLGLGGLSNLSALYLGNSNLSGVITQDHLANLVSLKVMDLSLSSLAIVLDFNSQKRLRILKLTYCQVGPRFPVLLKQQKGISQIEISNTGIADTIPDWFWDAISDASLVDMSHNQIYGNLPTKIEAMTWQELYFSSNQLNGSVPELLRNVTKLDISRNLLSGPLPSNFQAPEVAAIVLFNNYISGVVPKSICSGFVNLAILDLSNNLLSGKLPECNDTGDFATLGFRTLLLANNSLSGEFPTLLKICKDITFVDLAKNNMHGSLPAWIGDLSSLVIFRLRSNIFSGHIPSEITRLKKLQYLDLAFNNISGMIPHSLANLTAMTSMNLDPGRKGLDGPFVQSSENFGEVMEFEWYGDSLYVAIKGRELPYSTQLQYLVSIDLSSNNLVGKIPEEVGSLVGLINLNLSSNHLTGIIPYQIGILQLLESLDISHNQISGEIPQTLSNLTSLSYLNMSYNNLSGRIPSGHQLDTLDTDDPASMYIGNTGLCGRPLPNNCSDSEKPRSNPIRQDSNNSAPNGLHLGAIVGFVIGLWLVFCAFMFKRKWRIAYFRFVDNMYDKAYVFIFVNWAIWFRDSHNPSST